jgi:hypothetical protein
LPWQLIVPQVRESFFAVEQQIHLEVCHGLSTIATSGYQLLFPGVREHGLEDAGAIPQYLAMEKQNARRVVGEA